MARKAGFDMPEADDSRRLTEFDKEGPRCPVCTLMLPHDECLKPATAYARSGRPTGGDIMGWRHGE